MYYNGIAIGKKITTKDKLSNIYIYILFFLRGSFQIFHHRNQQYRKCTHTNTQ